jgi:CDP-glycerol glycerophosphotransferase (TagB/SpsB family)
VLLYAPTWTGLTSEFDYSSLSIGRQIVEEALRRDLAVILRSHPYTRFNLAAARRLDEIERILAEDAERSGRAHLWGSQATGSVSLVDCVNAADIAVCDVSGVATDWIASDRPFAVTDMGGLGERFADEAWIAKGAYRIEGDGSNLESVFDELLDTDSKAAQRKETREYFLGPASGEESVSKFVNAARAAYRD